MSDFDGHNVSEGPSQPTRQPSRRTKPSSRQTPPPHLERWDQIQGTPRRGISNSRSVDQRKTSYPKTSKSSAPSPGGGIESLLGEFSSLQFSIESGTASATDVDRAFKVKEILARVDKDITQTPPDWNALPTQTATVWITVLPTTKDDLRTKREPVQSTTVPIKIATYPFARGGVRAAFHARVWNETKKHWKPYVVKMFLEPKNQVPKQYLDQLETNGVAKYLAKEFMKTSDGRRAARIGQKIKFIESRAIAVPKDNGEIVWYNMESVVDGKFEKWTDNNGFCNPKPENRTLIEFAKWTYDWTNGFMMATDLQGCQIKKTSLVDVVKEGWVLTDPAMLCQDLSRFGPTNFSEAQLTMTYEGANHVLSHGRSMVDGAPGTSYIAGFSRHDDGSRFGDATSSYVTIRKKRDAKAKAARIKAARIKAAKVEAARVEAARVETARRRAREAAAEERRYRRPNRSTPSGYSGGWNFPAGFGWD